MSGARLVLDFEGGVGGPLEFDRVERVRDERVEGGPD